MQVADEIAAGCQELGLPVRWTQQDSEPIAIVEITSEESDDKRRLYLDSLELNAGELYVAGHTEVGEAKMSVNDDASVHEPSTKLPRGRADGSADSVELTGYELLLTPGNEKSALEIARKPEETASGSRTKRSTSRSTKRLEK
jgi:hypothetical protein